MSTYRSGTGRGVPDQNYVSSRHNQRRSQLPRELPEIERPPTQGVIDIKMKKLSQQQVHEELVEQKVGKIASTLDRLN